MVEHLSNQIKEGGSIPTSPLQFSVREIPKEQTYEWLLKKHYAHRIPSINYAFGVYGEGVLVGVCTFGLPPSINLANACGDKYRDCFLELNRLVLANNEQNLASHFISRCFKLLPKPQVIVSYSDPDWGHHGYIYQALNGIYTGVGSSDINFIYRGKQYHRRHIRDIIGIGNLRDGAKKAGIDVIETAGKHRYFWFLGNRQQVADMKRRFRYPILPYPKGDNKKYNASHEPPTQGVLI